MSKEVKENNLKVTSLEQLKQYSKGEIVQLPEFSPNQPFVARLKRPSILAMAKNGKIPNKLLVKTNELFTNDGMALNSSDENMLGEIFDVIDVIAEEVFVEPTYDEIKQNLLTAIEQAPDLNSANVFLQEAIKYYPNLQQDQEVINALSKFSQPNNQPQQPIGMTQDEAKQFVLDTLSKYKSFQEFTKSEDAAKVQDIIENKFKDLQNDSDIINVLNKLQGIKEEFEIISFKNIPENLKKDLLKASEWAKANPYTNDDFEKDDSNSDLKFGDIVKYGNDEYGVITGINLSDSNNPSYQIIKLTTSNNTTNTSGNLISRKDIVGLIKVDPDDIISYQDPEPETLSYADNINPITGTDIVSDQDYQAAVDISTQGGELPQSTANSDEGRITIDMLLHTFNTFETGVLFDQNNYPIPVGSQTWMDARIDSVNGLVKIDKILGNPTKTKEEYIKLIGKLRNILFNTEQKSEICEELEDILIMNFGRIFLLKNQKKFTLYRIMKVSIMSLIRIIG